MLCMYRTLLLTSPGWSQPWKVRRKKVEETGDLTHTHTQKGKVLMFGNSGTWSWMDNNKDISSSNKGFRQAFSEVEPLGMSPPAGITGWFSQCCSSLCIHLNLISAGWPCAIQPKLRGQQWHPQIFKKRHLCLQLLELIGLCTRWRPNDYSLRVQINTQF